MTRSPSSSTRPKPHLRPYQAAPAEAILRSCGAGDGAQFVVVMARQSGKNELSAWVEAALLGANAPRARTGVKCAPTQKPQVEISGDRLRDMLARFGLVSRTHDRYVWLGRARWAFLSAERGASVVGHTCHLLLEADEAQDIGPDKWNKEFRPMGATTNCSAAYYGTPWTEDDLLGQAIGEASGTARLFRVPWSVPAELSPAYARYVAGERDRLGANHPLFLTQYELAMLPGAGRLLSPAQLAALRGTFSRQEAPSKDYRYVAGIDVAGEDSGGRLAGRDSTVMIVARLVPAQIRRTPDAHVVAAYEWTGTPHAQLYPHLARLCESWRMSRVAVDSTAAGEALAIHLERALGEAKVIGYRFTEHSKSALGYGLQAAATTGRLRVWADDGSREYARLFAQLRLCRVEYRANRAARWSVDASDGHDDYVAALALCNHAAEQAPAPRVGRVKLPA